MADGSVGMGCWQQMSSDTGNENEVALPRTLRRQHRESDEASSVELSTRDQRVEVLHGVSKAAFPQRSASGDQVRLPADRRVPRNVLGLVQ